ncbi:Ecdysone receptor [Eumeta japonica]|uniref:Ecdysone receptor n=1 Tax=Eumeta variegata TaxID=151549 RepID=A0A4C1Z3A6_EUMVA|nr:Ecdysone receptor [Eumeta japonica]
MRMLEESSSEVTSSSALGLPPAMVMSPESLASPEYGGLELWGYEDALGYGTGPSLLGTACAAAAPQQPAAPLPSMPLPMPPTTPKSENESISSGQGQNCYISINVSRLRTCLRNDLNLAVSMSPRGGIAARATAGVRPIAAVVDLCSEYLDLADGLRRARYP